MSTSMIRRRLVRRRIARDRAGNTASAVFEQTSRSPGPQGALALTRGLGRGPSLGPGPSTTAPPGRAPGARARTPSLPCAHSRLHGEQGRSAVWFGLAQHEPPRLTEPESDADGLSVPPTRRPGSQGAASLFGKDPRSTASWRARQLVTTSKGG